MLSIIVVFTILFPYFIALYLHHYKVFPNTETKSSLLQAKTITSILSVHGEYIVIFFFATTFQCFKTTIVCFPSLHFFHIKQLPAFFTCHVS